MSQAIEGMRATLLTELATVQTQLDALREQRDLLHEAIKAKVAERDELRSTISKLTPRTRKSAPAAVEAVEPIEAEVA